MFDIFKLPQMIYRSKAQHSTSIALEVMEYLKNFNSTGKKERKKWLKEKAKRKKKKQDMVNTFAGHAEGKGGGRQNQCGGGKKSIKF